MANILLLDPNETARRAMHGILARGGHRFAAVDTAQAAWDFLSRNVQVDLVFVELGLKGESGLGFIERLKRDGLRKLLPVVVYTATGDRNAVRRGLELRVQNFLIKPYHDDDIFGEIAKATANPWRNRHFEEEKSFCKMMGLKPDELERMLAGLRTALEQAAVPLLKAAELKATRHASEELAALANQAEVAGAWGVVDCLKTLNNSAKAGHWAEFGPGLETLDFATRLISQQLAPTLVPLGFLAGATQHSELEVRERAVWFNAPLEHRCPVTDWRKIQREIEALPGCPVIDSAAAAFQMAATGHPSCLNPLMDLVEKDPGLAAQMLIAANQAKPPSGTDRTAIEDPRLAVGLLGELRLTAQARGFVVTPAKMMELPPAFDWQRFWMFQIGTARTARFACKALEFPHLAAPAYTAGLLHDLGKLLLLRLHPFGLQATLEHARQHKRPLAEVERLFLGCTSREMAAHFAEKHGLPRRFANVMRWIESPREAAEDKELVAIVSLARGLCRHNQVGSSGDKPLDEALPLEETEEWRVLRECVFPGFKLRNFELQVHAECRELKLELHGRLASYAVA
ncbi:MAG: HDOD domain-containing protein [Opitutae bacterium]|nr:HDOD domain-containing protein [Opitutae bacterium]